MKKIVNKIELIDEGFFYRWKFKKDEKTTIITQGFTSLTGGLKILEKELKIVRKNRK